MHLDRFPVRAVLVALSLLAAVVLPNLPEAENPTVPSGSALAFAPEPVPTAVAGRAAAPGAASEVRIYHAGRRERLAAGKMVPVLHRVAVHDRVVFLTIDDGYARDPRIVSMVHRLRLPLTLFLIGDAAQPGRAYFRSLVHEGAVVENHTQHHPYLNRLSYRKQKAQICTPEARDRAMFGSRPALLRPPYGRFDDRTRLAARACGTKALVLWRASVDALGLHTAGGLLPGDIILLHFRDGLYEQLLSLLDTLRHRHLGVGLLEEYLDIGARPRVRAEPSAGPSPTESPTPSPTVSESPTPLVSPLPTPS